MSHPHPTDLPHKAAASFSGPEVPGLFPLDNMGLWKSAQWENKTKRPSLLMNIMKLRGKRSLSLAQPRPRGVWDVGVDNTFLTANQHPWGSVTAEGKL